MSKPKLSVAKRALAYVNSSSEDLMAGQVAKEIGAQSGAVSWALKQLYVKGLIYRGPHPDHANQFVYSAKLHPIDAVEQARNKQTGKSQQARVSNENIMVAQFMERNATSAPFVNEIADTVLDYMTNLSFNDLIKTGITNDDLITLTDYWSRR